MEKRLKQLDAWHKTKTGFLVFGLVGLGLAYLSASVAIDTGNLWHYVLTLAFLFAGLSNLIRIVTVHKK